MSFSGQVGYHTRTNLEYFGFGALNSLGTGLLFLLLGSVFASNITEDGLMNFHKIFRICRARHSKTIGWTIPRLTRLFHALPTRRNGVSAPENGRMDLHYIFRKIDFWERNDLEHLWDVALNPWLQEVFSIAWIRVVNNITKWLERFSWDFKHMTQESIAETVLRLVRLFRASQTRRAGCLRSRGVPCYTWIHFKVMGFKCEQQIYGLVL